MLRLPLVLSLVSSLPLVGCPSSFHPDAAELDAPSPIDGGTLDAPFDLPDLPLAPDAGLDPLARVLSCDLTHDTALAAIVRHVACLERREHASVDGFYEAWEAGLFSGLDVGFTSFEPGLGCTAWRCLAEAGSCDEARACVSGCADPTTSCDGDTFVDCSGGTPRRTECAALGMRCTAEGCALGECVLRSAPYQLSCDGAEITLCDGAIRARCPAGTACASFAVSGEVPTVFCSPGGEPGYGAYGSPIECADGVIAFEGATGRAVTYDCVASGYAGCDEWGCVP